MTTTLSREREACRLFGKLISTIVMVSIYLTRAIRPDWEVRCYKLWIESPSKKTRTSLPFYQALRVVRKQGWRLVDTIPKPTRWQAFKMLVNRRDYRS